MNLRNIGLGYNMPKSLAFCTFPFNNGYIPVCNITSISIYSSAKYFADNPNYDLFKYYLDDYVDIHQRKEDFDKAAKKYEEVLLYSLNLNLDTNIGFSSISPRRITDLKLMFFNIFKPGRRYPQSLPVLKYKNFLYYTSTPNSDTIIVAKGGFFLYKNERVVPLLVLMVESDYAKELMFSSVVDNEIDYSKLQWWINSEIEDIQPATLDAICGILKSGHNDGIEVLIKGNMKEYFLTPPLPNFKSITERMQFFIDVKNNYINRNSENQVVIEVPKVELINVEKQFKNKVIREFVGQEKYNKYKLIA